MQQLRDKKEWIKIGIYELTAADKEIVTIGQELNDNHINAAQLLIKQSFPELGGLQNTFSKIPLEHSATSMVVQIIHVNNNHWAALSSFNNSISYYDSAYTTLSPSTKKMIAN